MTMALSPSARTHLIYQFIIITLVFLGVSLGCYALLPQSQQAYTLYITLPMLASYAVIFCCCLQILPVPQWMESQDGCRASIECRQCALRQVALLRHVHRDTKSDSFVQQYVKTPTAPEAVYLPENATPAALANHRDTNIVEKANLLPAEQTSNCKSTLRNTDLQPLIPASQVKPDAVPTTRDHPNSAIPTARDIPNSVIPPSRDNCEEESELERSYSYPFRQKRLELWAESHKNIPIRGLPEKIRVPYCQTVGYILAMKKEAQDRRRVSSMPCSSNGATFANTDMLESNKPSADQSSSDSKFGAKGKIMSGLSSFLSRNKDLNNSTQDDMAKRETSRVFSLFGRRKKADARFYMVEGKPDSAGRDFLDPDSEDDPFEPDTLEDHLSLFPEGTNRLSKKAPIPSH